MPTVRRLSLTNSAEITAKEFRLALLTTIAAPAGVDRFVRRAKAGGLKAYVFVDLVVLPTPVLVAWPNATGPDGTGGTNVLWNNATQQVPFIHSKCDSRQYFWH
jgi:hypothetical protein